MSSLVVIILAVAIGLILVLVVSLYYNSLVVLGNRFQNAFSQIDVQLKRRYALIPNLVECVKGYMAHEKTTLEAVIQARNTAQQASRLASSQPGNPAAMADLSLAEGQLGGALGRLIAVAEGYPDLKANQNMLAVQEELTSTENKIGFARQGYNDSVTEYNTARESFPDTIFASFFQFKSAELLQATESAEERQAVKVKF